MLQNTLSQWKQIELTSAIYTILVIKMFPVHIHLPSNVEAFLTARFSGPVCSGAWWRAERDVSWICLPAVEAEWLIYSSLFLRLQAHSIRGGGKSDVGCCDICTENPGRSTEVEKESDKRAVQEVVALVSIRMEQQLRFPSAPQR